jgi:hypothetical protein
MNRLDITALFTGDDVTRRGRLRKAREFADDAEALRTLASTDGVFTVASGSANSYVALCVLSGIASADAICVRVLGQYSKGGSHEASVALLARAAGRPTAKHLATLLSIKSKAEYNAQSVEDGDVYAAGRAMQALLGASALI